MIRYIVEIGDPVEWRFSSAVRNPIEPTDATYPDGTLGSSITVPPRLIIPSLNSKLSDSISGTIIRTQQTIIIANDDGKYDDVETNGWFNIPLVVKRTDIENPTLADFQKIFSGTIEYPIVTQKDVQLKVNNTYRDLTEEVTKTFSTSEYPNLPDGNVDKDIPIGYGPDLRNVPLFEVDTNKYIAIDPDYLNTVTTVYDADHNSISFTVDGFGVISATDGKTADVSGISGNSIGDIITSEVSIKSSIPYTADNWEIVETDEYIVNSASLNFYFKGGTVRQLVDAALKSDNAFLFTKNNGLLTIRQWGRIYSVHTLQSWQFMKFPIKDYSEAARYYIHQALIQYNKNIKDNAYEDQLLSGTVPAFDREKRGLFPTDLYTLGDLEDLGSRLIKRFGILSEIIPIASGAPTIEIDLLDLIELDVTINGRVFSDRLEWIVREVDPGQDTLSLESRTGIIEVTVVDGTLSQPMYSGSTDGVLSQPMIDLISGVLSQSSEVVGE